MDTSEAYAKCYEFINMIHKFSNDKHEAQYLINNLEKTIQFQAEKIEQLEESLLIEQDRVENLEDILEYTQDIKKHFQNKLKECQVLLTELNSPVISTGFRKVEIDTLAVQLLEVLNKYQ
jgi:chromosome segregation ATPase